MKYLKYFELYTCGEIDVITTFDGLNIPEHIDDGFDCKYNELTSLKYGPKTVSGYFDCSRNRLTSLEFCPEYVGKNFSCYKNQLTSLEFCPETVSGSFNCGNNNLTSLEYCIKKINGGFFCYSNKITSLIGLPENIVGVISCGDNKLKSLDYIPKDFNGKINCCSPNDWTNPIPYILIEKYDIRTTDLYTTEQVEKFGSYEYQKEYLTNTPEKYKDLEPIGYHKKIKKEFDWLFNAIDMGLM